MNMLSTQGKIVVIGLFVMLLIGIILGYSIGYTEAKDEYKVFRIEKIEGSFYSVETDRSYNIYQFDGLDSSKGRFIILNR